MADANLQRLQRHFGNQIDVDVLASVLAVCNSNVDQAIRFLTAGEGDYVVDPNRANENSLPRDYPAQNPTGRRPVPAEIKEKVALIDKAVEDEIAQLKKLFVGEQATTLQEHHLAQTQNLSKYVACLLLLLFQGVELAKGSRPRILAVCWALKHNVLADYLLKEWKELFGLPDVLRALQLMDAGRKVRAYERRIDRLQKQGGSQKKINQVRGLITDVSREVVNGIAVTGSLCKRIRKWISTITSDELHFYALQMPKEPWQELADIIHIRPTDFQCDWFLHVTFGKPAPENSVLKLCLEKLDAKNVVDVLAAGHKIPYSYLRTHVRPLPNEAKDLVAVYAPLDTLIWYHEELQTPGVDTLIGKRLAAGEVPKFSYGKLMERLLYFKRSQVPFYNHLVPIAEKRLSSIELLLEPPVTVLGDGSYSMDVAIRTATIISSVLTVLTQAELKFFNVTTVEPPCYPTTITEVIDVAEKVVADGLTAPASALWPYYVAKKPVKFFIVVTDEIENGKFNNLHYFPDLFLKYYQEVYPSKLVFVSFLENPNVKGRMVQSLENMGIEVLQFRLDGKRPDLTKMDTLLGLLSSESSYFPQQVLDLAKVHEQGGIPALIHRLNNPPAKPKKVIKKEKPDDDEKEKKPKKQEELDIPDHFCCPITLGMMRDPVITPSGHTYERSAIVETIGKKACDPLTGEALSLDDLRPNRALKEAITSFCTKHGLELDDDANQ